MIRVLCLCTGNSARSIIAEALLRQAGIEAASAGTDPRGVHPLTVEALREAGVDASALESKHVGQMVGQPFSHVITLCDDAAEHCPVFPGDVERIHWAFPDPAAVDGSPKARLDAFRETVRLMTERVREFARTLE